MSISKITKESVSKVLEIEENLVLTTSTTGNIQLGEGAGGVAYGRGIAIGYQASKLSPDRDMVAIGSAALNSGAGQYAVGVGYFAGLNNAGNESVSIGLRANESSGGQRSIAIGTEASSSGTQAVAVGMYTTASSTNSIAVGESASATASEAVALGHGTTSAASKSTALGVDANSSHTWSTAIGARATTTAANQIMLGTSNEDVYIPGTLTLQSPLFSLNDSYISMTCTSSVTYQHGWNYLFKSTFTYDERAPSPLAFENVSSITWYAGFTIPDARILKNTSTKTHLVHVTAYLELGAPGGAGINIGKLNSGVDESQNNEVRTVTTSVAASEAGTVSCTEILEPNESLVFTTYQSLTGPGSTITQTTANSRLRLSGFVAP